MSSFSAQGSEHWISYPMTVVLIQSRVPASDEFVDRHVDIAGLCFGGLPLHQNRALIRATNKLGSRLIFIAGCEEADAPRTEKASGRQRQHLCHETLQR